MYDNLLIGTHVNLVRRRKMCKVQVRFELRLECNGHGDHVDQPEEGEIKCINNWEEIIQHFTDSQILLLLFLTYFRFKPQVI